MKKILIAYFSLSGKTEAMAQYVSEGVRFTGNQAVIKTLKEIRAEADLAGYDGYILGSPTYHRDMAEPMKTFLFLLRKAEVAGKPAGAFGSYTHDGNAPAMIYDTLQYVYKMKMTRLGAFNLLEDKVGTAEGMRACQDYGMAFAEEFFNQ